MEHHTHKKHGKLPANTHNKKEAALVQLICGIMCVHKHAYAKLVEHKAHTFRLLLKIRPKMGRVRER